MKKKVFLFTFVLLGLGVLSLATAQSSLSQVPRDGRYYIVSGQDMNRFESSLVGENIRFTGRIVDVKKFPITKFLLLSEDGSYYVIVGISMGDVPDDLNNAIAKNALRPKSQGLFSSYPGDVITIWGTVHSLSKQGGLTGSVLSKPSCIVDIVHDWQKK